MGAAASAQAAQPASQQFSTPQQQQQQQQHGGSRKRKGKSKAASALSGVISGALVSAAVQPLDVIRTRMQADSAHGMMRSTVGTMRTIIAEGGWTTLWRGTQPTVIRLGLGAGLHFLILETVKPLFEQRQADGSLAMSAMGAMITGGLSRTLAAVAACPFTIVKTRMEYSGAGGHAYRGTLHALSSIWRQEGVRGLYAGLGPTALSQAPFSALYYMFYTRLQKQLKGDSERPSMSVNFVSGTLAAVAATVLTQPADVIRTRMQLNLATATAGAAGTAAAAAPQTTLGIFRHIMAEHGVRGLLSGAAPRVVKRTLQTALLWTLYEELFPAFSRMGEAVARTRQGQPGGGGHGAAEVAGSHGKGA